MSYIDKLLNEWAYRVHDGKPNPKNNNHIWKLRDILLEWKWDVPAINQFVYELREAKRRTDGEDWELPPDSPSGDWAGKNQQGKIEYFSGSDAKAKAIEWAQGGKDGEVEDDKTGTGGNGSEEDETGEEGGDESEDEVKKKPNNHQGQNLESINSIDGDAKQGGLEHKIKAPGDPKGAAGTNEICQGIGVAAINELGEDATDEEIADKVCDEAGGTKLGDKFICPSDYDKQIQKMEKESKKRKKLIQGGREVLDSIGTKHGTDSDEYKRAEKSLDNLEKKFKKQDKLDTVRKNAIKTKKDYMKSIVNSARAKHRRNQEVMEDEDMDPESTTTSHVWGSKQSLESTVDHLSQHKPPITEVNGIPFKNDPAELYEGHHDENGNFIPKLDKNKQKIAKPVVFDEKTGKPTNYAQVILNGGEGDNPTDTMFVMIDNTDPRKDGEKSPKAVIVHDSDKMTSDDLQGNSGPKKTLDNGVEHFKKKWENDPATTEICGVKLDKNNKPMAGTGTACTKSQRAEEAANNSKRKIDKAKADIKETISKQSTKFTKMTGRPRTKKKKKQMDNLLRLIREKKPTGISSLTEYPPESEILSGKYYNYLQKRYKDEIEEFKNNNPNASQEDIDYHMLEQYAAEYEKVAPYAHLTKEDFIDQRNRSKPDHVPEEERIEPTDPDYVPSDAKQPTEDMQKIAVRTMYREDEINTIGAKKGEHTEPILKKNTLKDLYDQQTTELNNFRKQMNAVEDGAGDEFFVEEMVRRFHLGVSEGHSPAGIPANKFSLMMGRNKSGIRYRTNKDGTTTIFRKVKGTKYVEIDENGDEVKGGETASTGTQGHGLEEGSTATVGDEDNLKHCLGVDLKDNKTLEETIEVEELTTTDGSNQAEALIYVTNPKTGKRIVIARQTVRSKTGPGGSIADTITFEPEFQNCLQLASYRNASKK